MDNNRFLTKFESKNKLELKEIIDRAENCDPKAIEAAKHILENYSDINQKNRRKTNKS